MTKAQIKFKAINDERSEIRGRMAEILLLAPEAQATDAINTERAALTKRQAEIEPEYRAAADALEAEQNTTTDKGGEGAERRALIERADFGNYLGASLSGRALDGAEAELNAACGAVAGHGGTAIPWPVLVDCRAPVEKRADSVTSLPADGNEISEESYVARLFAGGSSEFLMARHVILAAGSISVPVVESGPTAEYFANSAVADASASGVVFKTADPTRLQCAVVLRSSDIQRSPGLILAVQSDLAAATADAVDKKIITQLFADLTDATDASAIISYENFIAELSEGVDGKAANSIGQVRALLGVATYKLASGKISTTATCPPSITRRRALAEFSFRQICPEKMGRGKKACWQKPARPVRWLPCSSVPRNCSTTPGPFQTRANGG